MEQSDRSSCTKRSQKTLHWPGTGFRYFWGLHRRSSECNGRESSVFPGVNTEDQAIRHRPLYVFSIRIMFINYDWCRTSFSNVWKIKQKPKNKYGGQINRKRTATDKKTRIRPRDWLSNAMFTNEAASFPEKKSKKVELTVTDALLEEN